MRLRFPTSLVIISALALGGVAACGPVSDDATDSEAAVEAPQEAADSEAVTDADEAEPTNEVLVKEEAPAEATEAEVEPDVAELPRGSASCKDPAGDVINLDTGEAMAGSPRGGTDLTGVSVLIDADAVRITWEAADPVTSDAGLDSYGGPESVMWGVHFWAGDKQVYTMDAHLIGNDWSASAYDAVDTYSYQAIEPSISGNRIMAIYLMSDLDKFAGPLTWAAFTEQNGTDGYYHDLCPNSAELYPPIEDRLSLP